MGKTKKASQKEKVVKTKSRDKAKIIRIACEGAATIELDTLLDFQGNLKSLSDEAYKNLRTSIIDFGFSFPINAWKNGEKIYILDAHQRVATLKRMRSEDGYKIPPLPVVWVDAANEKEAANKVLAATSQYGSISPDGLFEFMQTYNLTVLDIKTNFKFPEIDLPSFELTFFPKTETVSFEATKSWKGMPEFKHEDKQPFRSIIVHFFDQDGVDKFGKMVRQNVTDKTKMIWYPDIVIEKAADKRYAKPKK